VDTVIKPFLTQPGANSVAIKDPTVLIVTDYAANILRVAKLVQLLDKAKPNVSVRFITVKNMEAAALAQQLSSMFTARGKAAGGANGAGAGAEIASDARTNQLLLVGTREQIDEALELTKSLDVPLGVKTEVYTLRFASAERVERIAKELIDPVDAKRLFRSAVDTDGNLLIVTGTPRIHEQVAAIQQKLDLPGSKSAGLVKFYKLKNVKATEVLDTIRAMDGKSSAEGTC
ncbi:MAG: secretin N-terminal domain-containing protein, partial [Pirellulales bacterium]